MKDMTLDENLTVETLKDRLKAVEKLIGNTPLYPLQAFSTPEVHLYAKLEWFQLGGSVKARPAFRIIKEALKSGQLTRDKILLDASSGNTAIAYAAIGAALGIQVKICIPENSTAERKNVLKALGAEVILTSPFGTTDEAQEVARELAASEPDRYFYADQYGNANNWKAHYATTGEEVYKQTAGNITHFVCGIGTSGTLMGTGRRLIELNPDVRLIALQPDTALHGLEGWKHLGTAKVPTIYSPGLAHESWTVSTSRAYELMKIVAQQEGLMISPSAAANLAGAIEIAQRLKRGTVVTVFPDSAEKYGELINEIF